jgi:EAL domain-containing protein (putative c-di-GMP-specific phosphodiesterase class I)
MRTRVHLIPVENSDGFLLIEILCSSRSGLEALQQTIACIEFDRIDLAYQKQFDLKTNKVTGIEALLRMKDEQGEIIPNDIIIPQIEGESLFSLVVLASLVKLSEFFKSKESLGLSSTTVYLNVSAHTVMHPEFCNIFINYVETMNLKPNEFGLEVTETAELGNTKLASASLQKLKDKGIKIALDDFGAGYSSLRYLKDLPVDVVKLDKMFTEEINDPVTGRLIGFVVEVCEALSMEMIGEGIETEEQKKAMMDIGCPIGQGFLMHRPEFLETFQK